MVGFLRNMLNNLETSTKESLFFKIPTLLADILVQVLTLQWLLYGTTMVREKNLLIYEKPPVACCPSSFSGTGWTSVTVPP